MFNLIPSRLNRNNTTNETQIQPDLTPSADQPIAKKDNEDVLMFCQNI